MMPPGKLPQKRFYRQRAHSNPMSDHSFDYPAHPSLMDWRTLYPEHAESEDRGVEFADIGCGYGGLLVSLSPMFPDTRMLGMEIRVKVADFVADRIQGLREQQPGHYQNIACVRTNAMKYLPNFFTKGQLSKLFFLFPDPHFKKAKHKWRIINQTLLAEYAFILREGGIVYTLTDVEDLHLWMKQHFTDHPLFAPLQQEQLDNDPVVQALYESTEEGQKVTRNAGQKYLAVFTRLQSDVQDPDR